MSSDKLHPWRMPQPFCSTLDVMAKMYPLQVYNSLTRTKVRFIPSDPKRVTWYQCGPTVYAESHMGHARTYVSLDIIRRICKDFLGYNVILCQNVTDVDDKIIIRSSERKIPFRELAAKYEAEFNEDMALLGVQAPDVVTRVSEYIPEIVAYIVRLVQNGIAYESKGSVYFSVTEFQKKGHTYGKLMPEQVGNAELVAEGEGSLADANEDKRSPNDFALWKKTKDHKDDGVVEPSWDSPWGPGRPGWHIECSAMSGSALDEYGGGRIDVHAGGVDLKFPHHENEIAQSEGYQGCNQWVNYWLHTGHVNIKGAKMSKSLKNFTTIRDAALQYSPRQIRFCFLLHKYNEPMDYGENTMMQAVNIERIFNEFFLNVKAVLRRLGQKGDGTQYLGEKEHGIMGVLETAKTGVREALLDDFDTPRAMGVMMDLIKECNKSVEDGVSSSIVLSDIARFITETLRTFGVVNDTVDIGFPLETSGGDAASKEQVLTPFLDVLTKFREAVRLAAMSGDTKAVLEAADGLRDNVLPDLGVRMEDKGSGKDVMTVWKLDDPEQLRKEKALREEQKLAKEAAKAEAARKQREKEEKAKMPASEMFTKQTDLYSQFDATGLPTHDKAGEPLSKAASKKLLKEYQKQQELHEKYMAKAGSNA